MITDMDFAMFTLVTLVAGYIGVFLVDTISNRKPETKE